ncbi:MULTISPECIES: STAS domain-containing protein [Deefgea]|uniref:STAS domain-containing protein n=1 Tax=Deefgea chitinilytica TaxID=570276 RepID=A0ABS2CC82_9NEIS|nr:MULTISPECIES: STAS domain-containing protein [Deefgea]MBM5571759.1 STAS domain-containing protein [Deefgea chitinilytica]MBM9888994.1 STAS domain-containing protein [Deefgea sp. CFH1-16]
MHEIVLGRELTLRNSPAALNLLDSTLATGRLAINFAALEIVDSSAVAVLLEWQRRAKAAQCQLVWHNLPNNLRQLIAVYGLLDVLNLGSSVDV